MDKRCDTCQWFCRLADDDPKEGECRHDTPAFLGDLGTVPQYGYWPIVHADDWCSHWELDTAKTQAAHA